MLGVQKSARIKDSQSPSNPGHSNQLGPMRSATAYVESFTNSCRPAELFVVQSFASRVPSFCDYHL
jgi:hypothetical protein